MPFLPREPRWATTTAQCSPNQEARLPMAEVETKSLPENAYQALKPGESYPPIVAATVHAPELTARSIGWGILLCVIFTVASAYSGLKVGQVMESAIPISILAIGLARLYPRRSSLLENVIITGIGGVAGSVVAGAVFTVPALYILKLDPHPVRRFLSVWPADVLAYSSSFPYGAILCGTCTACFPTPKRLPSRKCWSPARKADRKRSCCSRPRPLRAFMTCL